MSGNDFHLIDHPAVPGDENASSSTSNNHQRQGLRGHTYSNSRSNPFDYDEDMLHSNPYGADSSIPDSSSSRINNNQIGQNSFGMESNQYLHPVDSFGGVSTRSAATAGGGATSGYDYFDGTGIAADIDEHDDFLNNTSQNMQQQRKTKGISGLYTSMKSKLGMNPDYTEMDLPLTDQGQHQHQKHPAGGSRYEGPAGGDEEEEKREFDIRRIWHKIIGKKETDPSTLGPRIVELNSPSSASQYGYKDNHISTTKYNVATFLPKFLFEQFSKYANLFFLFTAAIQQVPNVSPTNRYTTIGTLAVVLSVSAVKELTEDVKRLNADKELNNSQVEVLNTNAEFEKRRWIKVQVGDIVRVNSEEPFPADIILLASSEPEGLCYIETANLDGETNLKIKQACGETSYLVSPQELNRIQGRVLSEQPNSSLYTYEATLELQGRKIPLQPDQLLLRGATLRNTPWIHGVVVFTGHETKLMRNATAAPIKRTAVEHMLNLQIIFLFSILIILAIVSSLGNVIKIKVAGSSLSYLQLEGTSLVKLFFSDILTYWVLFSNLVPIS